MRKPFLKRYANSKLDLNSMEFSKSIATLLSKTPTPKPIVKIKFFFKCQSLLNQYAEIGYSANF
jgi:hypothetical protein